MTSQKTDSKPHPPGKPAEALEGRVEETTVEVIHWIERYRSLLIFIGLAIVAWLVLPDFFAWRSESALRDKNARIAAAFDATTPVEVRSLADKLLVELKGDPSEVALALRYTSWLIREQGDERAPQEQRQAEARALEIATDVRSRHPDSQPLNFCLERLRAFVESNKTFEAPKPPSSEGPTPSEPAPDSK